MFLGQSLLICACSCEAVRCRILLRVHPGRFPVEEMLRAERKLSHRPRKRRRDHVPNAGAERLVRGGRKQQRNFLKRLPRLSGGSTESTQSAAIPLCAACPAAARAGAVSGSVGPAGFASGRTREERSTPGECQSADPAW